MDACSWTGRRWEECGREPTNQKTDIPFLSLLWKPHQALTSRSSTYLQCSTSSTKVSHKMEATLTLNTKHVFDSVYVRCSGTDGDCSQRCRDGTGWLFPETPDLVRGNASASPGHSTSDHPTHGGWSKVRTFSFPLCLHFCPVFSVSFQSDTIQSTIARLH